MRILLIICLVLIPWPLYAGIIIADSCANISGGITHVQDAIDAAVNGDTVVVPSGSCTWTEGINVPDGITLKGAGIGSTVIESAAFITVYLFDNTLIEGFDFSNGLARGSPGSQNWVAKECHFGNTTGTRQNISLSGLNMPEHQTGVFHKCHIEGIRFVIDGKHIGEEEWAYSDDLGGTENVIYIEGCTIDPIGLGTGAVGDGNRGGQAVWRFNTFIDGHVQTHGSRGEVSRGFRKFEWYRNTITRSYNHNYAFWNRGGMGVMFDNNCSDVAGGCAYLLDTERVYEEAFGLCASDNPYDNNPHPGTIDSFACRDATGVGQDKNPPSSNLPAYQNQQTYSPGYFWNNKYNGSAGNFKAVNGADLYIIEGRDYFLDASSDEDFGDGGVSSGIWDNIPSCSENLKHHGYWATDMGGNWNTSDEWDGADGALYVCDGAGTWKLYYTPAKYPHPLINYGRTTVRSGTPATITTGTTVSIQ